MWGKKNKRDKFYNKYFLKNTLGLKYYPYSFICMTGSVSSLQEARQGPWLSGRPGGALFFLK